MKLSAEDVQGGMDCDDYLRQHLEEEKHFEISLSDIKNIPEYIELLKSGVKSDSKELFEFLHQLGLDTKWTVEEQYLTHRNKTNKVVTCPRWVGYQRTDKKWLNIKKGL
tara:strand:+ start:551 stop:877 length:327 start_codon:yes stop_codon:yes gene_type:complete